MSFQPFQCDEFRFPSAEKLVFPEGITANPITGDFYVGSQATGTIFRGNVQRPEDLLKVFVKGVEGGPTHLLGLALDGRGRLYAAGDDTGFGFVYDVASGQLLHRIHHTRLNPVKCKFGKTLLNDVVVHPDGDAFFTDSFQPMLLRVPASNLLDNCRELEFESWLAFDKSIYKYGDSFLECLNLNGIVVSNDGKYLITVQSNTGTLFRIDIRSQEVLKMQIVGGTLEGGDGLVLDKHVLYVVRDGQGGRDPIVRVELSSDCRSGQISHICATLPLKVPTTAALVGGYLLIVNSQFDKLQSDCVPDVFTVSRVPLQAIL
jgi:sugar lactone lactonase YvrE